MTHERTKWEMMSPTAIRGEPQSPATLLLHDIEEGCMEEMHQRANVLIPPIGRYRRLEPP